MNKISLVAAAVALSMVIGSAIAAVVTPQIKVPTPHIKTTTPTPKVTTPKTGGHFEIKDFSFGVQNPSTIGSATGGAGAGKVKFNEFNIKKTTDSASPKLFDKGNSGSAPKETTTFQYGTLGVQYHPQTAGKAGKVRSNEIGSATGGAGAGKIK